MLRENQSFARYNGGALQHVPEFANVTRPCVILKSVEPPAIQPGNAASVLLVEIDQNRFRNRGDIVLPVAQWRQEDVKDIQPVIQVLTQQFGFNGLFGRSEER